MPINETLFMGGGVAASLSGNSTSAGAGYIAVSSGTLYLAGGNNITLSQNGSSVTISAAAIGAGSFSAGVSTGGNTLGDTKTVANQLVLVGGSNITLSQGTNLQSATVTIVGAAAQSGISGLIASDATYTTGTVAFVGSNAATVLSSGLGQTVVIDVPVQTLQTSNVHNVTLAGSTSGALAQISSGTMTLAGGNNIVLSQNGNAVTISAINSGVVGAISGNTSGALVTITSGTMLLFGGNNITLSQSSHSVTISAGASGAAGVQITLSGNTSGTLAAISSGTMTLAGGNNITVSQVGNAVTISGPSGGGAGASTMGNTAGTTGTVDYQLVFVGGSNISLSQSINGSSGTLTINGAAGGAGIQATMSGNTSGTLAAISSGTWTLAGGNNITLSQVGNAVTISGPTQTSGAQSIGMSNLGNTAGTSGMASGNLVQFAIVGSNNVTLSQSINGASGTITINAAAGGAGATLSQFLVPGLGYSSYTPAGQSTLVVFPVQLQENLSISRADLFASVSVSTSSNSSYQGSLSLAAGIYTRNVSTMSLASSGSVAYTWNGTGSTSSGSLVGLRNFSLPLNAVMTPGNYFIGVLSQSASSNANWVTFSNLQLVAFPNAYSGLFGGASAASNQLIPGLGIFSAQTAALPASVAFGDLLASSASTARPVINLLNYTA